MLADGIRKLGRIKATDGPKVNLYCAYRYCECSDNNTQVGVACIVSNARNEVVIVKLQTN